MKIWNGELDGNIKLRSQNWKWDENLELKMENGNKKE